MMAEASPSIPSRALLEETIERLIMLLDATDADSFDREPDSDDEDGHDAEQDINDEPQDDDELDDDDTVAPGYYSRLDFDGSGNRIARRQLAALTHNINRRYRSKIGPVLPIMGYRK